MSSTQSLSNLTGASARPFFNLTLAAHLLTPAATHSFHLVLAAWYNPTNSLAILNNPWNPNTIGERDVPWNIEQECRGTRETSRHACSPIVAWSQEQGKAPNRPWGASQKNGTFSKRACPLPAPEKRPFQDFTIPAQSGFSSFTIFAIPVQSNNPHTMCAPRLQPGLQGPHPSCDLSCLLTDHSHPTAKFDWVKSLQFSCNPRIYTHSENTTCRGILNKETDGTYITVLDSQADRWRRTTTMLDDRVIGHRNESNPWSQQRQSQRQPKSSNTASQSSRTRTTTKTCKEIAGVLEQDTR